MSSPKDAKGGKGIKKVRTAEDVMTEVKKINKGTVILLILKKDLKWDKYLLTIENNKLVAGEPKIPSESDFKDAILALLIVPHTIKREEGLEKIVESAGLDVESLPEDVKRLVQLIPGIELFIPDKDLLEAGVGETVIPPDEIMDEVVNMVETMIKELGLEGQVKVANHELYVIVSKRVPKKVLQQLEKVLETRVGDLFRVKVTTG